MLYEENGSVGYRVTLKLERCWIKLHWALAQALEPNITTGLPMWNKQYKMKWRV